LLSVKKPLKPGAANKSSGIGMVMNKKLKHLAEAILFSIALMIFSYFIHHVLPYRFISFVALLVPSYIIGSNLKTFSDLKQFTGEIPSLKIAAIYTLFGLFSGIMVALLYRWSMDIRILPSTMHNFVITAAFIGSFEELLFRGFLQDYVKSINGPFSILFSTISHTGYKCCLFLAPLAAADFDIGFIALATFITGFIFGTIRHLSKSIIPSLVAHAIFDIIVYAEYIYAPWWVW
jgi:membrane protease YdiL (CAAX protease family)